MVTRVAPDLSRYLQTYYPCPHSETIPISQNKDNPKEVLTPILEEPCTRQTSTTETTEQANVGSISTQEKERPPPVRITMTADRLQTYQEKMKKLTNCMVLGHISGRTPGARKLSVWAKANLHRSFHQLTIRSNNYFETQFSQEEGRLSTLASQGSTLEGGGI